MYFEILASNCTFVKFLSFEVLGSLEEKAKINSRKCRKLNRMRAADFVTATVVAVFNAVALEEPRKAATVPAAERKTHPLNLKHTNHSWF